MVLLVLQMVALGWRVQREINGKEPHPFPWVPVPDNVNIGAMLAVLYFCIIAPLTTVGVRLYSVTVLGRAVFVAGVVLIALHPLIVASHYGLWSGRRGHDDASFPYCNRQEAIVQLIALALAATVFAWVLQAANTPTAVLSAA
jgi:hypothetical protein